MTVPVPSVATRFKPVLDAAPDAMIITDRVGRMVVVSAQAERLFGYLGEELLGQPVEMLIPERFRPSHPHHRNRYFQDPRTRPMGGVGGLELFGLRKDGTEFPAEISLSPLDTDDGMYAITAIRDVTARRKVESHVKALLEAAPDAMVIADLHGKIRLVNAQAEKLFGYTRDELLGQRVEALIPARFRAAHPGHRAAYFAEPRPRPRPMGAGGLELLGLRKDGTEFPAEISLSPLQTDDGLLSITAIRDVAERRRGEEERARLHARLQATLGELEVAYGKAKDLEQLKARFFANVSHELRTPLALILGPAEKLLDGHLPEGSRQDVEVIARNARTLVKHVNDLLDVTKLEAGKMGLDLADVDVAHVVRVVASHFDALAAERGTAYAVEAPPELVAAVDAEKLQRVLFNLLSNAFKFAPRGGRVRCALHPAGAGGAATGRGLRLEVADSGPGVRPDQREAVFARFARGDDEATRRVGGTGLGLAIAKEFVELHGGTVGVGDAPEGGALFVVELPPRALLGKGEIARARGATEYGRAAVEELRPAAMPVFSRGGTGRPRVLVAEDNPDMSRFLGGVLAAEFEVTAVPDGEAALAEALARPPDAIVTDLTMPRMTGDELVRAVRRHAALDGVPVLVITARSDDALRLQLLREGAQDYLMKPFVAEEVRARLSNLVAVKRARDVLQHELASQSQDVVTLAGELAARKRDLEAALAITEVARDEAQRASAVKTQFLRLVSHELRTPLTALHLQLARLSRDPKHPLDEQQRQLLRKGSLAATRLTGIIEALLSEALIASGRLASRVEDVDLAALVTKVVEEARPQAEEKSLALRIRAQDHVPWVATEPRFLKLILGNLVGNAIKYTFAGLVEVRIETGGDEARVSVADSGPGIPVEEQSRLFEPFERGERDAAAFVPGLGLGLAIVRELGTAIGARVELVSAPGAGSVFTVALPVRQPAASRGAGRLAGPGSQSDGGAGSRVAPSPDWPV